MHNLHIEAITLAGSCHLASITLPFDDPRLAAALQRECDERGRGQRWFPPDTSQITMTNTTVTVDDENPDGDGRASSEVAAEWIKDGHSFVLGPFSITDPDIKAVLVMSEAEAQRLGDEMGNSDPTLSGILGLMGMWNGRPGILGLRLIAW
jgi:hypothetical protein